MFLDESGFLLIPTRRRTWGPEGRTPILHYSYKHDRISALAALTVSAVRKRMGIYTRFQKKNFKAPHVAAFLRNLLRHLRGSVILVWDQGRIHRGSFIRQIQLDFPRLRLEPLPKYAPELNPTEQIWNNFKGRTANSLYLSLQEIRTDLFNSRRRVAADQAVLRSFVLASDLPSPPW